MRLATGPRYSIVVAAAGPRAQLEALLTHLVPSCQARDAELVVARACDAAELRDLAAGFPSVLFMPAPDDCTRRQLRALGLTAADGDVVTLLDDDRAVPEGWVEAVTGGSRSAR